MMVGWFLHTFASHGGWLEFGNWLDDDFVFLVVCYWRLDGCVVLSVLCSGFLSGFVRKWSVFLFGKRLNCGGWGQWVLTGLGVDINEKINRSVSNHIVVVGENRKCGLLSLLDAIMRFALCKINYAICIIYVRGCILML